MRDQVLWRKTGRIAALLADRYSPVYVQLSPRCVLPD